MYAVLLSRGTIISALHPYASVCIHMHPSGIRMHTRLHCASGRQYSIHIFAEQIKSPNNVSNSQSCNCMQHPKSVPNSTQYSKSLQLVLQNQVVIYLCPNSSVGTYTVPFLDKYPHWLTSTGRMLSNDYKILTIISKNKPFSKRDVYKKTKSCWVP